MVAAIAVAVVALAATPVLAATVGQPLAAAPSVAAVIVRIKVWLIGLAVGVWGAMFVYGALLYSASGVGQKDLGKRTMRDACIGFMLTMSAPLVLTIVQGFVS
ncbi:hypothetical protein [Fodinicola acaciae]|uniref:hypothetical protein n=1 Tax=Fodinicola acaciae TaxID=2681555 RepID=UPI0013D04ED0|nr:hypothetical protein [Fodinicola acaciae]